MPDSTRLIPNIESGTQPVALRARTIHQIIRSVNRNTLAVSPPRNVRQAEMSQLRAQGEALTQPEYPKVEDTTTGAAAPDVLPLNRDRWVELRRLTSTVRVTNPDDEDQYVDVSRIDAALFITGSGNVVELFFANPASE